MQNFNDIVQGKRIQIRGWMESGRKN